jgi:glycine/D-amino acid oxidase-like deaminating enzyme
VDRRLVKPRPQKVVVAGGGIFGATAALALAARGCAVTLLDPAAPLPSPLAESTDRSKVVRLDYGSDAGYLALAERALDGWRAWNRAWPAPLFHETGVAFLSRGALAPGGFEHDSFHALVARGHRPERLDASAIAARFPAWRGFEDGYFNPEGGWAESGRVVAALLAEARARGVTLRPGAALRAIEDAPDGVRILSAAGESTTADRCVIAAGAWAARLLPELDGCFRQSAQPVFHLAPRDRARFAAERFPVFGADIARTGWYGFPIGGDGIVKIANHGPGRPLDPSDTAREVTAAERAALAAFLAATFPQLASAEVVAARACVYGDSADGHFWIARHPDRPRLTLAAGGSGHAFKFAPALGALIASACLDGEDPEGGRFRWRPERRWKSEEEARFTG